MGLHFFNPPPVMELLEIVRGLHDATRRRMDTCVALAPTPRQDAIVVADTPGFATSRLGVAIGAEAMRMLEPGVASAADIDRAMELGYRHPMGPLKLTDLGRPRRPPRHPRAPAPRDRRAVRPPSILRRWSAPAASARRPAKASTHTTDDLWGTTLVQPEAR